MIKFTLCGLIILLIIVISISYYIKIEGFDTQQLTFDIEEYTNNGTWTYIDINISDFIFFKGDSSISKDIVFSNISQFLFSQISNTINTVYIQYVVLERISNTNNI